MPDILETTHGDTNATNPAGESEAVATSEIRKLMLASIPPRFCVGLVAMVFLASVVVFSPLELPQPSAGDGKAGGLHAIPAPPQLDRNAAGVSKPLTAEARGGARRRQRGDEAVNVPDEVVGNTLIHTVRRGESVTSIAHRYLSRTIFLTTPDLEAAIHEANAGKWGRTLSPGYQLVVPGYEPVPIVERPVLMAKDREIRAIYLTGLMAGSKHGVELIRSWKDLGGNAIVFDIKDSNGSVSVPFDHALAPRRRHHDIENLPKFARYLHSLGLHGIARIAVFRDEELVEHHPELAVRSRQSGQPWRENGKLVWADPSRPEVQDYNIALARQATSAGIDEVQFDYIRFPAEGDQKAAQFFFQTAHPDWQRSKVIADFLSRAYAELHPVGVLVSVDVFGVMAWQRPVDLAHTGQDITAMSRHCDVLSPMIYPSHFFGMDGYSMPGDAPEHFIAASMERLQEITAETGVVLRPWLQAFGWRTKTYSSGYILKQVDVAKENDGIGFMFWNARNDYSKPFRAMAEMRPSQVSSSLPRVSPQTETKDLPPQPPAVSP